MGHQIYIWDSSRHPPTPKTWDEAASTFNRLSQVTLDETNPGIQQFGRMVHEQLNSGKKKPPFPGIIDLTDQHRDALLCIGLPRAGSAKAYQTIVDIANYLDLTLFDDSTGHVFLPNGGEYAKNESYAHIKSTDIKVPQHARFPQTNFEFTSAVTPVIVSFFRKHGFDQDELRGKDHLLARDTGIGRQFICIRHELLPPILNEIIVEPRMIVPEVQSLAASLGLMTTLPPPHEPECTYVFSRISSYWIDRGSSIYIQEWRNVVHFLEKMERELLPNLDQCRTLKDIDQIMNGKANPALTEAMQSANREQCLILACMTRNPDFEAIVKSMKERIQSRERGERREKFLRSVEDLAEKLRGMIKSQSS